MNPRTSATAWRLQNPPAMKTLALTFALLLPLAVHAEPLSLTNTEQTASLDRALKMRTTGAILTSVGIITTIASQVLLAFAIISGPGPEHGDFRHTALPEHVPLIGAAAATVAAGNAMLGTGLGLWGTANHRIRDARRARTTARLGLSATPTSGTATFNLSF